MFFTITVLPLCALCYLISKIIKYFKEKPTIKGKHVLIIGGSSGIGKALAIHCAELGSHVTIVARDCSRLKAALNDVESHKVDTTQCIRSLSVHCDNYTDTVTKLTEADDALAVDMLICCAGKAICGTFTDLSIDDMTEMFNVNLLATLYPLKALLSRMKGRKRGCVVITGSQGGLVGLYGMSVYAATKFALRGLAESLHMEMKDHNVSVTLALPPDTDTPGFALENESKPLITKKLSEAGGLESAEEVAKRIIIDATEGNFFSYIGLGSFILTNLAIGMAPVKYTYEITFQALLLGPLRIIGGLCLFLFHRTITRTHQEQQVDAEEKKIA